MTTAYAGSDPGLRAGARYRHGRRQQHVLDDEAFEGSSREFHTVVSNQAEVAPIASVPLMIVQHPLPKYVRHGIR